MKRILLPVMLSIFISIPCFASDTPEVKLQNIFLTDTTEAEDYIEPENIPLKGYAEYIEDSEAIYLTDDHNQFVLNLKVPQKITTPTIENLSNTITAKTPVLFSKYGAEEYQISPKDGTGIVQQGGLSFGTNMEQDVDYGQLEHSATFFTKYNKGCFTFNTAYKRTIGSTYNSYYDNIYVAPELRLNKYISIKQILTADITRDRRKNEFVFTIRPLAKKSEDRLNLEFGASQTYDADNALIRKQLNFNTKFKL